MLTARILVPIFLSVSALAGCRSPFDERASAEHAQREADQKATQATQEAEKKLQDVHKRAAQETDAVIAEASDEIRKANTEAREAANKAQDELAKARADVRSSMVRTLSGLEKDVAALRSKLERKLSKSEAETIVKDLDDKSASAREGLRDLDAATDITLDVAKRTVERRVEDLDRAVQEARKRV